jgi:23S rRNA (cytosine1962-C5)-methyltransferase
MSEIASTPSRDPFQLLDFGDGRKLERFGAYVFDRPAPAAEHARRRSKEQWTTAVARYDREHGQNGRWSATTGGTVPILRSPRSKMGLPPFLGAESAWQIQYGPITLELKLTESGHLGAFPEQAENWDWIARQVRTAASPIKVLNLFAYTGASTLAAAAAGAEVTHVDAAAGVVAWARRNAELSGLAHAPIRWITDDATKFARRELKRGRSYDAVILDPPSYGHGPRAETWKLEEHLDELLALCWELMAGEGRFLLLTCHSGELAFGSPLTRRVMALGSVLRDSGRLVGEDMALRSLAGEILHCGAAVRWSRLEAAHTASEAISPAASERSD